MFHFLFLNVGGSELIIIALFVLLFFGSKSIPEFMRGLGKMSREFKDAMNGLEQEVRQSVNFEEPPKTPEPPKLLEEKPKLLEEKAEEKKSDTVPIESGSSGGNEQNPATQINKPLN